MNGAVKPSDFFSKEEETQIVNSIKEAEKFTFGEIRVHIERKIKGDIMERAVKVFNTIGMHKTKERNGCLIILDLTNRRFAIIGDSGINDKVGADFWNEISAGLSDNFKRKNYTGGLCAAILKIGEKLNHFFPHLTNDVNELPDEISKND